jgi:magnesium transporter
MQGRLTAADGSTVDATLEMVRARLSAKDFFWLDLVGLDAESTDLLLHDFDFHPLAVEDAEQAEQRPKVDDYDSFTYLVVHGAGAGAGEEATVVVHIFFSDDHVVTVHRGGGGLLDGVRQRLTRRPGTAAGASPAVTTLYLVVDVLVDSFFPVLADLDDRIDELEDEILKQPTEAQLGELFDMKRTLVALRKVVTPERDMFARLLTGVSVLDGVTLEAERYFRDLYDHLIRISDLVDSYRDLLTGAMDTHLSTVSNRLNSVMKQLTIIATIFLPLSFLTGFFGQNFAVLTGHALVPAWSFWVFGVGLELAAVAGLLYLFRQRGWLGGPTE